MQVKNERLTLLALVNVFGTIQSFVSGGAGAGERAVDRAGVADRALVTRIRRAGIVEMTEESWRTQKREISVESISHTISQKTSRKNYTFRPK